MSFLQKIAKHHVWVDAAIAANVAVAADAAEEDDITAMLDPKLREDSYCEPTYEEKLCSQIDSNDIQKMYELSIGRKGKMSYFVVDKYCKLHGEYKNWDKYRIHLAEVSLTDKLLALEYNEEISTDTDDKDEIIQKYEKKLKEKTKISQGPGKKEASTRTMDDFFIIIKQCFDKSCWETVHSSSCTWDSTDGIRLARKCAGEALLAYKATNLGNPETIVQKCIAFGMQY